MNAISVCPQGSARSLRWAVAAVLLATASDVWAQQAADDTAAPDKADGKLEEIIITGTRRTGLTMETSARPIDVVTGESLVAQGSINLNDALREQIVSLNVQQFVAQDGSAFVRPFSLRGLPPDQTLVLVNGKRRHRSALVQITNQPLAAGAQGPDLATIPAIAVEQIEVLRDGASAQYGSDAIAGVINFRLKRASEGGMVVAQAGRFMDGGGDGYTVQGNIGLPLTSEGFFNLSGEYSDADATSRGAQRPDAQALIDAGNTAVPVPAQRWGNVPLEAARFFFNAELPATDAVTAYAFGNYSWSDGDADFFWRNPVTRTDIFASVPLTSTAGGPRFTFRDWFPGGFTPTFGTSIEDMSLSAGAKGATGAGLEYDLSFGTGASEVDYRMSNTVNASYGPESPTKFKPGTVQQRETRVNADFVYPWAVGSLDAPVNVAFGAEWREETFQIIAGDVASWEAGPYARVLDPDTGNYVGLAVGSSGFPGFAPSTAGVWSRSNVAAYLDIEADVTDRLTIGAAARYEDFSDFGGTFNWKLSGRFEFNDYVALRGSVNTGFRAPTPGQSHTSSVATNIDLVTGGLLLTATLPPTDPISEFYGAEALTPEESFNLAGGLVFTLPDDWFVSIDYFNIEVDDRVALTSPITITAADRAAMLAQGIDPGDYQRVRFFGNYFDTKTEGVDLVFQKPWELAGASTLTLSGGINYTTNEVSDIKNPLAINRERRIEIKEFNPKIRGNVALDYERDRWHGLVRLNYYGEWTDAVNNSTPTPSSFDQTFPEEWLVNLEVGYDFTESLTFTLGADNLFNTYPDKDQRLGQQANGIVYPQFSPFGFSGGYWYGRLTARF
jgi:iron complex outermembrane receptor protein